MNRFDLTKRLVAKLKNERSRDRRHRQYQFRPVGRRPAAAEFLHAGQHGPGDPDRARRRHGAAAAARVRARRRRLAADAAGLPVHHRRRWRRRTSPSWCWTTASTRSPARSRRRRRRSPTSSPSPRGCGLANSAWAADEEDFERLVATALKDGGPTLIGVRIDDKPAVGTTRPRPDADPRALHARDWRALGTSARLANNNGWPGIVPAIFCRAAKQKAGRLPAAQIALNAPCPSFPECRPSSPCARDRTGCSPPSWSSDWRGRFRRCAG